MLEYDMKTVMEARHRVSAMMTKFQIAAASVGDPVTEGAKKWREGREESFNQVFKMLCAMLTESK